MSTRATYRFESASEYVAPVTYYIHHDGYPTGAAVYFYDAIKFDSISEDKCGGIAASFMRANMRAEFTSGHDAHGDTDYQYTVTTAQDAEPMLVVRSRCASSDRYRKVYGGTLREFIAANANGIDKGGGGPTDDGRWPLVAIASNLRTPDAVLRLARERWSYGCEAMMQGWTGNACGSLGEAVKYAEALEAAGACKFNASHLACIARTALAKALEAMRAPVAKL